MYTYSTHIHIYNQLTILSSGFKAFSIFNQLTSHTIAERELSFQVSERVMRAMMYNDKNYVDAFMWRG